MSGNQKAIYIFTATLHIEKLHLLWNDLFYANPVVQVALGQSYSQLSQIEYFNSHTNTSFGLVHKRAQQKQPVIKACGPSTTLCSSFHSPGLLCSESVLALCFNQLY